MRVSKILDSIFGVPKKLGLMFKVQQRNGGMDPPPLVLKVREYPPGHCLFLHDVLNMKKHICSSVNDHIDNSAFKK